MHLYDDFWQFEGEQFPDRPVQLVSPLSSWHRSLEDGLNSKGIDQVHYAYPTGFVNALRMLPPAGTPEK